jgi:hypothetical protein
VASTGPIVLGDNVVLVREAESQIRCATAVDELGQRLRNRAVAAAPVRAPVDRDGICRREDRPAVVDEVTSATGTREFMNEALPRREVQRNWIVFFRVLG